MFPAAKAQFDLAMAWSELAMSTWAATASIAAASSKVIAASADAERAAQNPANLPDAMFTAWTTMVTPRPQLQAIDPMQFAFAANHGIMAFWAALLNPQTAQVNLAASPPPQNWWTNFSAAAAPKGPTWLH